MPPNRGDDPRELRCAGSDSEPAPKGSASEIRKRSIRFLVETADPSDSGDGSSVRVDAPVRVIQVPRRRIPPRKGTLVGPRCVSRQLELCALIVVAALFLSGLSLAVAGRETAIDASSASRTGSSAPAEVVLVMRNSPG